MAGGLDTDLPLEHYLARRLTFQTPFVKTGVLLGELPAGGIISGINAWVTEAFAAAVPIVYSFNPDLSAPFHSIAVDILGPVGGVILTDAYVTPGRVYIGIPGATNVGALIATLRLFPQVR